MLQLYYRNNSHCVEITGLKSCSSDTTIDDATVTAVIQDESGTDVAGTSITLTATGSGNYSGVIPTNALTGLNFGQVKVVITKSTLFHGELVVPAEFKNRTC